MRSSPHLGFVTCLQTDLILFSKRKKGKGSKVIVSDYLQPMPDKSCCFCGREKVVGDEAEFLLLRYFCSFVAS